MPSPPFCYSGKPPALKERGFSRRLRPAFPSAAKNKTVMLQIWPEQNGRPDGSVSVSGACAVRTFALSIAPCGPS
jgi:hypothetical protein